MSARIVSAEEARIWLASPSEGPTPLARTAEVFAHTIVQQAEQIAAARALHADVHECQDGWWYPHDPPLSDRSRPRGQVVMDEQRHVYADGGRVTLAMQQQDGTWTDVRGIGGVVPGVGTHDDDWMPASMRTPGPQSWSMPAKFDDFDRATIARLAAVTPQRQRTSAARRKARRATQKSRRNNR